MKYILTVISIIFLFSCAPPRRTTCENDIIELNSILKQYEIALAKLKAENNKKCECSNPQVKKDDDTSWKQ